MSLLSSRFQYHSKNPPFGYLSCALRASDGKTGNVLCMQADTLTPAPSASPWRACAQIFETATTSGVTAVLWLVPVFDLKAVLASSPATVRFDRSPQPEAPLLRAAWWLFDEGCAVSGCRSRACLCGEVTLATVMGMLDETRGADAVRAHCDLIDAVAARFIAAITELQTDVHVIELAEVLSELARQLAAAPPVVWVP